MRYYSGNPSKLPLHVYCLIHQELVIQWTLQKGIYKALNKKTQVLHSSVSRPPKHKATLHSRGTVHIFDVDSGNFSNRSNVFKVMKSQPNMWGAIKKNNC